LPPVQWQTSGCRPYRQAGNAKLGGATATEQAIMAGGPDITEGSNKQVALLIAVMALFLALSEMLGKNAESDALAANVEASNLWAFFQAKTIRQTTLRTAAEQAEATLPADADARTRVAAQVAKWRATADRYESDPKENDGRRELMTRARAAEARREAQSRKDDLFEYSSAAFQIGIVMASAAIITGTLALAWLAGAFGLAGLAIMAMGQWAPNLVSFF
jgi:hypothetical protein